MKVLLFCLLVVAAVSATPRRYDGHKLFTVTPITDHQVEVLVAYRKWSMLQLDFWTDPHVETHTDIHVTPEHEQEFIAMMRKEGIPFNVRSHNIQAHIDAEAELLKDYSETHADAILKTFPRHANINEWLDTMVSRYDSVASAVSIGKSLEGRDMKVIQICASGACGRKPAIMMDAAIHAREWITVPTLMYIINGLLSDEDSDVKALVDKYDWYFLPVANPDGYEFTHTGERLWRKTRSQDPFTGCFGADPNRNFDADFGGAGTSSFPCSDTYHGSAAFSEIETANMRDFINSKKDKMVMYISLHSYTQLWLTPYAFTADYRPADASELDRVAYIGAAAIKSVNGLDFTVGTPPRILYAAAGGAYDWAKIKAEVKYAYTLELRPDRNANLGFIINESEIEPSGKEIYAAVKAVAQAIQA